MAPVRRQPVRVGPPAERAIRDGHPWVYDTSLAAPLKAPECGDFGVVFDRKERFLAIGLIDPTSPIRLRVVLHQGSPCKIDDDWFRSKIGEASLQREPLRQERLPTDGFRLINGESDGLPGRWSTATRTPWWPSSTPPPGSPIWAPWRRPWRPANPMNAWCCA